MSSFHLFRLFMMIATLFLWNQQTNAKYDTGEYYIPGDGDTSLYFSGNNTTSADPLSFGDSPSFHHDPFCDARNRNDQVSPFLQFCPNLSAMNTRQLINYFIAYRWTEADILNQAPLYMNNNYVAIAKKLPRYAAYVKKFYNQYHNYNFLKRAACWVFSDYKSGLKEKFSELQHECENEEKKVKRQKEQIDQQRRIAEQERVKKKQQELQKAQLRERALYIQELQIIETYVSNNGTGLYREERLIALAQTKTNQSRVETTVDVDQEICSFAKQYEISETDLTGGLFNAFELQLQKEFIDQLTTADTLHDIYKNAPVYDIFLDIIGHGIAYGIEANQNHEPLAALYWADTGEEFFEAAQAVADGIACGVYNVVDFGAQIIGYSLSAARHPIDSLNTLGCNIARVCSSISAGVSELANHIDFDLQEGRFATDIEWNQLANQVSVVADICLKQFDDLPRAEKVKCITTFATEFFVPTKIFKLIHMTCVRMRPLIAGALEAIRDERFAAQIAGGVGEAFCATQKAEMLGATTKEVVVGARTAETAAKLVGDYYEVNGFKFTQFYYDRLWSNGRHFPGFRAEAILRGAQEIMPDPRGYEGFYRYVSGGWEMIFNPETKIVSHLSKIKKNSL